MKKAIKKPCSKFGWPTMMESCWNRVPKLVKLACDEESEETETIYGSKSPISRAINLEPMRIFRCGKRHSVEAGDVYKHAKFQYNWVRTRLINDRTKLRLWRFGSAVIYRSTFAAWSLLVWGDDRIRGRTAPKFYRYCSSTNIAQLHRKICTPISSNILVEMSCLRPKFKA